MCVCAYVLDVDFCLCFSIMMYAYACLIVILWLLHLFPLFIVCSVMCAFGGFFLCVLILIVFVLSLRCFVCYCVRFVFVMVCLFYCRLLFPACVCSIFCVCFVVFVLVCLFYVFVCSYYFMRSFALGCVFVLLLFDLFAERFCTSCIYKHTYIYIYIVLWLYIGYFNETNNNKHYNIHIIVLVFLNTYSFTVAEACMNIRTYARTTYVRACVRAHMRMCVRAYVCTYVYMYVCNVCVCRYLRM